MTKNGDADFASHSSIRMGFKIHKREAERRQTAALQCDEGDHLLSKRRKYGLKQETMLVNAEG
jgi:hypothetical protein